RISHSPRRAGPATSLLLGCATLTLAAFAVAGLSAEGGLQAQQPSTPSSAPKQAPAEPLPAPPSTTPVAPQPRPGGPQQPPPPPVVVPEPSTSTLALAAVPAPPRFQFKISPDTPLKDLLPVPPKVKKTAGPLLGEDLARVPEVEFQAPPAKKLAGE